MHDANPGLLEIVPWSYGFAHSWAVKWLLEEPRAAACVVAAAGGVSTNAAVRVSNVEAEYRMSGARADLAFDLTYEDDSQRHVAFETKVNDPLKAVQLDRYVEAGLTPLLFLPGSTGCFTGMTPCSRTCGLSMATR
jgi:hypothetical protein